MHKLTLFALAVTVLAAIDGHPLAGPLSVARDRKMSIENKRASQQRLLDIETTTQNSVTNEPIVNDRFMNEYILPRYLWATFFSADAPKAPKDPATIKEEPEAPVKPLVARQWLSEPKASTAGQKEERDLKDFAFTPANQAFFKPRMTPVSGGAQHTQLQVYKSPEELIEPPRHTRQNPNLSRQTQKSLVEGDLEVLREGLVNEDLPVSINNTPHIMVVDRTPSVASVRAFYGLAFFLSFIMLMVAAGFAYGCYLLSKRAKAAADVDYPAYGVTGPTVDTSGDRKLAHSAHMYHYQHQKQQIIAMERSAMDERSGSISEPESDDENEEGDYTVYECPGLATTGVMEVRNPMFNEDSAPATPAKSVVQQEPQ